MGYIDLDINVKNFIDSYRNIGYTIETAIADIIDNSIFARATEIDIDMIWNDFSSEKPIIRVSDNGVGMTNAELIESMRLACKSPSEIRDPADLGRFGLGLKSASFSQCNVLSVVSKKDGFQPCCKQWNLHHIKAVNAFQLSDISPVECGMTDCIPEKSGTVVQWTDIDQIIIPDDFSEEEKESHWNDILMRVHNHIAIVFGSFKGEILFRFNGNTIDLWDPFLVDNEKTNLVFSDTLQYSGHKALIKGFVLPSKLTPEETMRLSWTKSMNDLQGFYIYRNNRLIVYGTWLGLPGLSKKEAYRLAHIRIDIGNDTDDLWNIDIKKEHAEYPPSLQKQLLAFAKKIRNESMKTFRSRGKTLRRSAGNEKISYIWTYGAKDDKAFYKINLDNPCISNFYASLEKEQQKEFKSIIKLIENYIPVMSMLTSESTSNGKFVSNNAEDLSEKEILQMYDSTITYLINTFSITIEEASQMAKKMEPFVFYPELIV